MKSIIISTFTSIVLLSSCTKEDKAVAEKSIDQQKLEYQARQLEIEKQKLAIEQEKIAFERAKDSLARVQQGNKQSFASENNAKATTSKPKVVTKTKTVYVDRGASNKSSSGSYSSNGAAATPVAQQKGMSKAAKGTIIGTVGGAAAGAVISKKNRGAGAVIGGIVGGATGYTIGRSKDKQEGRVPAK